MFKFPIVILVAIVAFSSAEEEKCGPPGQPEMPDIEFTSDIQVEQGQLRGMTMTTKSRRKFSAFLGIPYAKPPVEDLRFRPPVPADPWEGVKDATEPHEICPQRDIYRRSPVIEGDEDCLYLNVYTPQLNFSSPMSFPVMIFFHGGGWLCGGGNNLWYGPEILLDRDVVLVVPNYRLGALGFLSTGDNASPGNYGLKDQNQAIRWVKNNIAALGGDPERITLFGESAGGSSVQFHMASPQSKDLFHGAISQSGTAQNLWALAPADQAVRHARQLARAFNCPIEHNNKLVECLRTIDPYKIVEQDQIFMKWDMDPMIPFKPVIEPSDDASAFLTEHPIEVLKAGKMAQVPWIVGLNSEDGALRAAGLFGNPHLIDELNDDFNRVAPISLLYDETTSNTAFMTYKIRTFYFGDKPINTTMKKEVVDLYTDGWFLNGIDEAVRYYLKYSSQPVYYYLFGHRGVSSFTKIFGDPITDYGVCHADELQYLFPVGDVLFPDDKPSLADLKMRDIMTYLWVNFATTGNPTPDFNDLIKHKWDPVQSENMEYYDLNPTELLMESGLYLQRAKFWRRLPTHPRKNEIKDEL